MMLCMLAMLSMLCRLQFDLDIGDQDTSGKTLPHLREMTFNMTTGEASSRRVADTICDFPRVPLDLVGE